MQNMKLSTPVSFQNLTLAEKILAQPVTKLEIPEQRTNQPTAQAGLASLANPDHQFQAFPCTSQYQGHLFTLSIGFSLQQRRAKEPGVLVCSEEDEHPETHVLKQGSPDSRDIPIVTWRGGTRHIISGAAASSSLPTSQEVKGLV